jgi:mannosyltransferase OCH1-like enzyme
MQIKYGIINNNIDVTDICFSKLIYNGIITIPSGDYNRDYLFTDPLFCTKKQIFININDSLYEYDETYRVQINTEDNTIITTTTTNIPKNIFQTHKSMEYINSKPKVKDAVDSWLKHNNEFTHHFYDDNKCEEFMKNIGGDIYTAYQRLPINVMKADLWRYCVIYEYGGIYADTDTVCMVHPNILLTEAQLTIVPENSVHLCQWVFSAPSKSPILKSIIDLSVERILNIPEIKGEHIIHYLTGPGVFTNGIEKYLQENEKPVFSDRKLYFNYPYPLLLHVFDYNNFHTKSVNHLFTGQDDDGWCHERINSLL